jgi:hypothetical protein
MKYILSKLSIVRTNSLKGKTTSTRNPSLHSPSISLHLQSRSSHPSPPKRISIIFPYSKESRKRFRNMFTRKKKTVGMPSQHFDCGIQVRLQNQFESGWSKYKVRLVAQGFTQVEGTPIPLLQYCLPSINGMSLHYIDVNTADINAPLEEDLYMRPPRDFGLQGQRFKTLKEHLRLRIKLVSLDIHLLT